MSKLWRVLGAFAISASLLVVSGAVAVAQLDGALVGADEYPCLYLDGNGVPQVIVDPPHDGSTHGVVQESGVIGWTCEVEGVANDTGKAVKYDAFNNPLYGIGPFGDGTPCGLAILVNTLDWHETVSASGNMTLVCTYDPDDPPWVPTSP